MTQSDEVGEGENGRRSGDDGDVADVGRRRWGRSRGPRSGRLHEPLYAGIAERVEKILRLAEEEAKELREEAQAAAAVIIENAEREAARIRSEAKAEAEAAVRPQC
jgi:hypothetical protein